jgi:hypothetical protein
MWLYPDSHRAVHRPSTAGGTVDKKYLVLLGGAELLAAGMVWLAAASPAEQTFGPIVNAAADAVSDEAHAVELRSGARR